MNEIESLVRCPRCEAAFIVNDVGASSRMTRDDGASITICSRCGERESLYGYDPAKQIPFTEWPVSIETLLREEEALIRHARASVADFVDPREIDLDDDSDAF